MLDFTYFYILFIEIFLAANIFFVIIKFNAAF